VRELNARRAAEVEAELHADEAAGRRFDAQRTGAVDMSPAERLAEIHRVDAEKQRKAEARARALADWCAANGVSESDFTEQTIPAPHSPPEPRTGRPPRWEIAAKQRELDDYEQSPATLAQVHKVEGR
jgi:hypothetical protein